MSFLTNLFGGGEVLKTVKDMADEFFTSGEEENAHELEMTKTKLDYNLNMRQLDVEEQKLEIENTKSARDMQALIQDSENAHPMAKTFHYIFGYLILILTFSVIYCIIFIDGIDQQKLSILNLILGTILGWISGVVNFEYGSSKGSNDKNKLLSALNNKLKGN